MNRRISKLVLFLLLGAIVNVAVAWGCAAWSVGGELYDIYFDAARPASLDLKNQRWLHAHGWKNSPGEILTFGDLKAFGYYRIEYFSIRPQRVDPAIDSYAPIVARTRSGWPWLSLHAEEWLDLAVYDEWLSDEPIYIEDMYDYVGGVLIFVTVDYRGGRGKVARILPMRPLWIGFAINTIFYGTLLWLLTLGPGTARRMIRRKRGQCIKCGYDLRGTSGFTSGGGSGGVCPECGARSA